MASQNPVKRLSFNSKQINSSLNSVTQKNLKHINNGSTKCHETVFRDKNFTPPLHKTDRSFTEP